MTAILIMLGIVLLVGLALWVWTSPSITAVYTSQVTVTETPQSFGLGTDNTLTFNALNSSATLNAASTPAVTQHSCFQTTLSSGSATIDLTTLPDLNGGTTVSGTGLVVRMLKVAAPSTNGAAISFTVGVSNGYDILGATGKCTLQAGAEALFLYPATQTIGSSHKTIDLAGSGSTDKLSFEILMG